MKRFVTLLVACSLILVCGSALADKAMAPGQQKKESGDKSAKEYAPGHQEGSEAGAKKSEGKAKGDKGDKGDKGEADVEKATPDAGAPKAKGAGSKKK